MKPKIDPEIQAAWDLEDRHFPFFGHPHRFTANGKGKLPRKKIRDRNGKTFATGVHSTKVKLAVK